MKKELITHLKKDARRRKGLKNHPDLDTLHIKVIPNKHTNLTNEIKGNKEQGSDFDTWGDRLIIAVLILAIIALVQTVVIGW